MIFPLKTKLIAIEQSIYYDFKSDNYTNVKRGIRKKIIIMERTTTKRKETNGRTKEHREDT